MTPGHRLPRGTRVWRALASVRARALLSVGIVLGFGAVGTMAYWTDTATVTTGSFQSGSMDLQFDTGKAVGLGTGYPDASLNWTDFVPGQQKAFPLTVKNVGNADFHYTATVVKAVGWTYTDTPLQVQFYAGSVNVTDPTKCTGTKLTTLVVVPDSTTVGKSVFTTDRGLSKNTSEALCLVVGLDLNAANEDQSKTGSLIFNFSATQDTP